MNLKECPTLEDETVGRVLQIFLKSEFKFWLFINIIICFSIHFDLFVEIKIFFNKIFM
jgi:hypothetical protein